LIDNNTIASYTVSRFRAGWTGVAALLQLKSITSAANNPPTLGTNSEHPMKDANPVRPPGAEESQLLPNPFVMNTYTKRVRKYL